MPATAQVALDTARTLLNDSAGTIWDNTALLPKLVEAFRELQDKIKFSEGSIMRSVSSGISVAANAVTLNLPSNIIEPIKLWSKGSSDADSLYIQMTESDPLPILANGTGLDYWQWDGVNINFLSSTVAKKVRLQFWGSLTEPTGSGSSLVFINAEDYIAPRTAALACLSIGELEKAQALDPIAQDNLKNILESNRSNIARSIRP